MLTGSGDSKMPILGQPPSKLQNIRDYYGIAHDTEKEL